MPANPSLPEAAISRLATYLRVLDDLAESGGGDCISSAEIGRGAGVSPDQVRKDLSHFGEFGRPGVGYEPSHLRGHLARIMRLDREQTAVLVGAGHLGSALARYPGFASRGFRIGALFDIDPRLVGQTVGDFEVEHVDRLHSRIAELGASMGIIAVPQAAGQWVIAALESAGVKAILNFAPGAATVPDAVNLRNVDLARELECLAYYLPR